MIEDIEAAHTIALREDAARITLDCGHRATPDFFLVPNWRELADTPGQGVTGWVGYATTTYGRIFCGECAAQVEREAMRTAQAAGDGYFAYLPSDGEKITTWCGEMLARITHIEPRFLRAIDLDGNVWHAYEVERGTLITLHPSPND